MKKDNHGQLKIIQMNYREDRPRAKNPIKIQDVTFRDGHQSIFATRGRTEDMIIVAKEMDKVGFHSMKIWGGATFDTMHRFLKWKFGREVEWIAMGPIFSVDMGIFST